jgi:hypothetical protein
MWMGTMQDDSKVSWFPRQPIRYGILTQLVARLDSIILVWMRSMWVTPVANGKARAMNKSFGLLTGYTSSKSRDMIHHAGLMIIWKGSILQGRIEITWGIRLKPRKWQPLRLGVSPIYKICGHGARASGFHELSAEIKGYPSGKCLSWSKNRFHLFTRVLNFVKAWCHCFDTDSLQTALEESLPEPTIKIGERFHLQMR